MAPLIYLTPELCLSPHGMDNQNFNKNKKIFYFTVWHIQKL